MEDINLGRKTVANTVAATIAAGGDMFIPANGRRVGLIIAGSTSTRIDVYVANSVQADKFLLSINTFPPYLFLRIEDVGQLVQLGLTVRNPSAGGLLLSYTDITLVE